MRKEIIIGGVAAAVVLIAGIANAAGGDSSSTGTATAGQAETSASSSAAPTTPPVTKVTVPSLIGLDPGKQAQDKLAVLGLKVTVTGDFSNPAFTIISQTPVASTSVEPGTSVTVVVGESQGQAAAREAAAAAAAAAAIAPVGVAFSCDSVQYTDLHAVWALPAHKSCTTTLTGVVYSDVQKQAVATAYGADYAMTGLKSLYSVCSSTDPSVYPAKITGSDSQIKEVTGALVLCPDHPNAAAMQASMSDAAAKADKQANGGWATSGKHLVGTDIQPGTWRSVGDKVEDCYWETSDAEGNIMDNNFISIAPQFTIEIPSDAAGFTNSGCAFEKVS